MSAPFVYDDAHNHRLVIAPAAAGLSGPHVFVGAECMDIGGETANVWLPVAAAGRLAAALAGRVPFEYTDASGDVVTVAPAPVWTTFSVVRAGREGDEVPVTVRVVVLSARLAEVRAGLAGALPVPVGPEPQPSQRREVFVALYDGIPPEVFTTAEAARECCDDVAAVDAHGGGWDWVVGEDGTHVQFWTHPDDDRPLSETSGTVTPVVVQGVEPVSELETLRARVAELEAERHSTNEALSDAAERLRADRDRIAELEAAPATVFRASHDSIVMGLYTTAAAAREHCETVLRREDGDE